MSETIPEQRTNAGHEAVAKAPIQAQLEDINAKLTGTNVPSMEDLQQARQTIGHIEPTENGGFLSDDGFVDPDTAKSVIVSSDPKKWELTPDDYDDYAAAGSAKTWGEVFEDEKGNRKDRAYDLAMKFKAELPEDTTPEDGFAKYQEYARKRVALNDAIIEAEEAAAKPANGKTSPAEAMRKMHEAAQTAKTAKKAVEAEPADVKAEAPVKEAKKPQESPEQRKQTKEFIDSHIDDLKGLVKFNKAGKPVRENGKLMSNREILDIINHKDEIEAGLSGLQTTTPAEEPKTRRRATRPVTTIEPIAAVESDEAATEEPQTHRRRATRPTTTVGEVEDSIITVGGTDEVKQAMKPGVPDGEVVNRISADDEAYNNFKAQALQGTRKVSKLPEVPGAQPEVAEAEPRKLDPRFYEAWKDVQLGKNSKFMTGEYEFDGKEWVKIINKVDLPEVPPNFEPDLPEVPPVRIRGERPEVPAVEQQPAGPARTRGIFKAVRNFLRNPGQVIDRANARILMGAEQPKNQEHAERKEKRRKILGWATGAAVLGGMIALNYLRLRGIETGGGNTGAANHAAEIAQGNGAGNHLPVVDAAPAAPRVDHVKLNPGDNPWTVARSELERHGVDHPTTAQIAALDNQEMTDNGWTPDQARHLAVGTDVRVSTAAFPDQQPAAPAAPVAAPQPAHVNGANVAASAATRPSALETLGEAAGEVALPALVVGAMAGNRRATRRAIAEQQARAQQRAQAAAAEQAAAAQRQAQEDDRNGQDSKTRRRAA